MFDKNLSKLFFASKGQWSSTFTPFQRVQPRCTAVDVIWTPDTCGLRRIQMTSLRLGRTGTEQMKPAASGAEAKHHSEFNGLSAIFFYIFLSQNLPASIHRHQLRLCKDEVSEATSTKVGVDFGRFKCLQTRCIRLNLNVRGISGCNILEQLWRSEGRFGKKCEKGKRIICLYVCIILYQGNFKLCFRNVWEIRYSIVVIAIVKIIYQIKPSIFEFVYLNVGFFPNSTVNKK